MFTLRLDRGRLREEVLMRKQNVLPKQMMIMITVRDVRDTNLAHFKALLLCGYTNTAL